MPITAISDDAKTETFAIPATVTNEGDGRTYTVTELADKLLFQNQSILTMEDLPDTIEKTGDRTFDQMFNVRTFGELPANLKYVGYQSFGYLGWERQLENQGLIPTWQTKELNIPARSSSWIRVPLRQPSRDDQRRRGHHGAELLLPLR